MWGGDARRKEMSISFSLFLPAQQAALSPRPALLSAPQILTARLWGGWGVGVRSRHTSQRAWTPWARQGGRREEAEGGCVTRSLRASLSPRVQGGQPVHTVPLFPCQWPREASGWVPRAEWGPNQAREGGESAAQCLSPSFSLNPLPLLFLPYSESAPHADSDAEAADAARTSTFRLHEGTSHPSRAGNVDDLHRLQKSVTKARHDGKNGERWREGGEEGRGAVRLPPACRPGRRARPGKGRGRRERREKGWRGGVRALLSFLFLSSHALSLSLSLSTPFPDDAHERTIASLSETLKSSARV